MAANNLKAIEHAKASPKGLAHGLALQGDVMAQPPRIYYTGNTLYGVRKGKVIALAGASNVLGFEEGSFGTNPFTLRSGVTFWDLGVDRSVSGYKTPHGPEVGIVETLYGLSPSYVSGLTIVKRAVAASSTQNWIDTHGPALIADCVTAGVTPNILVMTINNPDLASASGGLAVESKMNTLLTLFRNAWGYDIGIVLDGPLSEDDADEPGNDAARLSTRKMCGALGTPAGELTGCMYWSDAHEDQTHLQISHRNHDAMMLYGARVVNATGFVPLIAAG